jgi:hypothetical protein
MPNPRLISLGLGILLWLGYVVLAVLTALTVLVVVAALTSR